MRIFDGTDSTLSPNFWASIVNIFVATEQQISRCENWNCTETDLEKNMAYSLRSMKTLGRRGFYSSPSSADFRHCTGGDSGFHMLRFYLGNLGSAFIVYALYQRQCRDPDEQPREVTQSFHH